MHEDLETLAHANSIVPSKQQMRSELARLMRGADAAEDEPEEELTTDSPFAPLASTTLD